MKKCKLLGFALALWFCLATAMGQSSLDQAASTSANGRTQSKSAQLEGKVLDLVVPTDLVIQGRDTGVAPLSTAEKFGQVLKNFGNPFTFIGTAAEAGIDQGFDVHQGYGQGAVGYGKRYGADIADTATTEFFGYGVYPSIFHTDPRYYRMGSGAFFSRGFYAASRVLITRTDSGRHIFNVSEILASATASGISRTYYPSDERDAGDFAYTMASRIAFDAVYNVAKEFWPDVRKHVFHGH
jgi:hypothetical protein